MAKKARRKKQSVLTQAQLTGTRKENTVATEKVLVATRKPDQATKKTVNFKKEYHYVVTDLRRIGVLAAVMLAVLVGLNLLLR